MTSSNPDQRFGYAPATLTRESFVERFGSVYEHSPWVADRTWQRGVDDNHSVASKLAEAMAEVLDDATTDEKLQLIRAHPDLAGKAALQGELTDDSTDEQSSAGLDQCTDEELARFQHLNDAYKAKFNVTIQPFADFPHSIGVHEKFLSIRISARREIDEQIISALPIVLHLAHQCYFWDLESSGTKTYANDKKLSTKSIDRQTMLSTNCRKSI